LRCSGRATPVLPPGWRRRRPGRWPLAASLLPPLQPEGEFREYYLPLSSEEIEADIEHLGALLEQSVRRTAHGGGQQQRYGGGGGSSEEHSPGSQLGEDDNVSGGHHAAEQQWAGHTAAAAAQQQAAAASAPQPRAVA
jgi:hypothetical protein